MKKELLHKKESELKRLGEFLACLYRRKVRKYVCKIPKGMIGLSLDKEVIGLYKQKHPAFEQKMIKTRRKEGRLSHSLLSTGQDN